MIVRKPYLSHGSQHEPEDRTVRAKDLNNNPDSNVVFRSAQELGLSTAYQAILNSRKQDVPSDGHRSVYYKIIFDEDLTDKVFGNKGVLHLHPIAWKSSQGVKELMFDIYWHVSFFIDYDDPRYEKRQTHRQRDYLADATQGMGDDLERMQLWASFSNISPLFALY